MLTSYNLVDYIDTSIASVVNQEMPCDWELLIGDDGSNDGTVDKIKIWIEMREDAKVSDALKIVHCGPLKAKLLLVSVNGERAALSQRLHEGDVVGFFMPVSGG